MDKINSIINSLEEETPECSESSLDESGELQNQGLTDLFQLKEAISNELNSWSGYIEERFSDLLYFEPNLPSIIESEMAIPPDYSSKSEGNFSTRARPRPTSSQIPLSFFVPEEVKIWEETNMFTLEEEELPKPSLTFSSKGSLSSEDRVEESIPSSARSRKGLLLFSVPLQYWLIISYVFLSLGLLSLAISLILLFAFLSFSNFLVILGLLSLATGFVLSHCMIIYLDEKMLSQKYKQNII